MLSLCHSHEGAPSTEKWHHHWMHQGNREAGSVADPFCHLNIFACSPNVPHYNTAVTPTLTEATLCPVLTAAHPSVCSNCLGTITIAIAGSWEGKKSINSDNCHVRQTNWRNKSLKENKHNSVKRNGRRWGCNRLDPGCGGWNVRAQVSKAPSLSLVSKAGKRLNKHTARISRKAIFLQYQQLPSSSLAHS